MSGIDNNKWKMIMIWDEPQFGGLMFDGIEDYCCDCKGVFQHIIEWRFPFE